MRRTRIKICGITRVQDALHAATCGADALGFMFYPPSPRAISPTRARSIIQKLPPFVTSVGLFVNEQSQLVLNTMKESGCQLLQLHGNEGQIYCETLATPYLKGIRVGASVRHDDLLELATQFSSAQALLLDSHVDGLFGGSGVTFVWGSIPHALRPRIVLSGGLTPENVGEAVRQIRPWGVDVSSGVESAKGIKDPDRVRRFIDAVQQADAEIYENENTSAD